MVKAEESDQAGELISDHHRIGLISQEAQVSIVPVVLFTITLNPPAFHAILRLCGAARLLAARPAGWSALAKLAALC